MNTAKIAAFYNPCVARLLDAATHESHQELLSMLLVRREDSALQTGYEVKVRNFAPLGTKLDQRCPHRVFAWACAQLPTADQRQSGGDSWSAVAANFTTADGEFLLRFSIGADFAILLRGIQHYQRKLDRRTQKQLAQLRTYHHQQCVLAQLCFVPEVDQLSELVVTANGISQSAATAPALTEVASVGYEVVGRPRRGFLPRLRQALAAKIRQVAIAAEAVLGEGGQFA